MKPAAIAGFFVLVALLWTFPLQQVISYPFVFLFLGPSSVARGLADSLRAYWRRPCPFCSLHSFLFHRCIPSQLKKSRGPSLPRFFCPQS